MRFIVHHLAIIMVESGGISLSKRMDKIVARRYQRQWRKNNRDRFNAYMRQWYADHKEAYRKRHRDYYWRNPLPHNFRAHANYLRSKLRVKERSILYWKRHPLRKRLFTVLAAIRQRCRNSRCKSYQYYGAKGIQCFLTLDELVLLWKRDNAFRLKRPSVDRINPCGNYELVNCQFLSHSENGKKAWQDRKPHGSMRLLP